MECVNFIFVMWMLLFVSTFRLREAIRLYPGRRTTTAFACL